MVKKTFTVCYHRYFHELDNVVEKFGVKKLDAIGFSLAVFVNMLMREKVSFNEMKETRDAIIQHDNQLHYQFKKTSVCLDEDTLMIINLIFAKYNGIVSKSDILNIALFYLIHEVKDGNIKKIKVKDLYE